ncbi:T-cell surface glycoprotein CD3 gamma chain-like [Eleutherodactylus coqui]|uniref:CD3 gamma/delta subunit Ig-like domain-containing protein n=1 Tax=Eleutherodactylus coqui TaxID=57060 RepID=A0A8J6BH24_ELECQ|nr:hypothetical protein GDO78_021719 [Eleutherodactylus coqui]
MTVSSPFWLLAAFLIKGVSSADNSPAADKMVDVKGEELFLQCGSDYTWTKDGDEEACDKTKSLGSLWNDPRGVYCRTKQDKSAPKSCVHVYVRRCMNCIELDPGTIAGFIVADIIMIGLIATAVYFVSGSELRRAGRASDKQNLIDKDAEYQVLGRRDNEQYSHLAPRPKRGGY